MYGEGIHMHIYLIYIGYAFYHGVPQQAPVGNRSCVGSQSPIPENNPESSIGNEVKVGIASPVPGGETDGHGGDDRGLGQGEEEGEWLGEEEARGGYRQEEEEGEEEGDAGVHHIMAANNLRTLHLQHNLLVHLGGVNNRGVTDMTRLTNLSELRVDNNALHRHTILKVLGVVTLYSKYTRALTFENIREVCRQSWARYIGTVTDSLTWLAPACPRSEK